MTGDLLQSDIELARRLIAEGETDGEIIVALGYRHIPAQKAQRLVQDLRRGVDVQPDPVRSPNLWRPVTAETVESHPEETPSHTPAPRGAEVDPGIPWFRFALVGLVAVAIAGVFLFNRDHRTPVAPSSRELMTAPAPALRRPVLQVEVEPHSVRVSGTVLSRENALKTLMDLSGPPSRTNQLDDLTMYAFDQQGTVLYAGNKAGKDSLLLYFETVGGPHGAEHPFTGTLSIHGKSVRLSTDAKTLVAIPELELKETATNLFFGQFNGVGLSFAYVNKPAQLSVVQIDIE